MQTSVAKKLFAVGLAASTLAWAVVPFTAMAAAHAEGTNIKDSSGTVSMIIGGQRRPYTSAGAFLSYGFNSWSSVVDANADDLALPVGSFIPPQDGTIFCATETKGSDVKGECSLITGGQKAAFTAASVFTGQGFSFSRAEYGDSSFLAKTANIDSATAAHKAGVLVNNNGTVQLVGASGLLGVPDLATFNSWGYSFSDVVPANTADKAMTQTGVMAARVAGQLSPTALASVPGATGNVNVALASDTPASGSIVAGQALADLAHFTFTGNGTVTSLKVHRIGVSADTTLNRVYLYEGNTRLTDAGSVSNGVITFSSGNLFTVNGSKTISVKADILTGVSGQTVGVAIQSASDVTSGTVTGSFPANGNLMTVASVSDIATVALSGTATGAGTSIQAGTTNATLWTGTFSIGGRAVQLRYAAFKQIGSIPTDALQNIKLYVDGVQAGSVVSITGDNNVIFDITSSPVTINTGSSRQVEVRGDIIKGSGRTFSLALQDPSNIVFFDPNYSVNIGVTGSIATSPAQTTVSAGDVTVQVDPNFSATEVVKNASGVVLNKFTMKAVGEDMKISSLQVKPHATLASGSFNAADDFKNVSIYINGGMVGSAQNTTMATSGVASYLTFGSGNLYTLPAGTTVTVEIRADIDVEEATSLSTVGAVLQVPANTFTGQVSYQSKPTSSYTKGDNTLSVVTGQLTVAKSPSFGNQIVALNSVKQKIGSYTFRAGNAESVRVTNLAVSLTTTTTPVSDITNLYTSENTNYVVSTPGTSQNFPVDFTLAANQSKTVDIFADVAGTAGSVQTSLGWTARSNSGVAQNSSSATVGQNITIGQGGITGVTKSNSSPTAQVVIAGSTSQPIATYNFQATSGPVTIKEMTFAVDNAGVITTLTVGGQTVDFIGTSVTVTGLNIAVPGGYNGVDVPVTVSYNTVGIGGGATSNTSATLSFDKLKYQAGNGSLQTYNPSDVGASAMTLAGTKPTVSLVSANNTLSVGTEVKVASVTLSADQAGSLKLNTLPLTVSVSGGATVASSTNAAVYVNGVKYTSITQTQFNASGANTITFTNGYSIPAGQSVTFDIYVNVSGTLGDAGSSAVVTSLGAASGFTWTDVNGNATLTGAVISGYPSTSVNVRN